MDERDVESDCVRSAHAGADCGGSPPRPPCGTHESVLDRVAEPESEPGLRRAPAPSRARAGLHPSEAAGSRGFLGPRATRPSDSRVGMVPVSVRDLVHDAGRVGGPVNRPVVRTRSPARERRPRPARGPQGASPLIPLDLWSAAFVNPGRRCTSGRIHKSRGLGHG